MRRRIIAGNQNLLVLLTGDEDINKIVDGLNCTILVFNDFDWNRDLSPWPAKAVFKGPDFTGGADETIRCILQDPMICRRWDHTYICGYSLSGLFALYLSTKTPYFGGTASCSGSLWYDGFLDYLRLHPSLSKKIYLSIGDKESHSRNQRMKTVVEATKEAADILKDRQVKFELNKGNHFDDPEIRMRKGIDWLLNTQ